MVEAEPHRRRRHHSRSCRGRGRLARPRTANPILHVLSALRLPRAVAAQVGKHEGLLPFIVIAHDSEHRPLLLLPLALKQALGVRCAGFMGGKHATFNMALWRQEFAADATPDDLKALISAISARDEADVLALYQQPLRWRDLTNPMALLPHQASVNDCPLLTMAPGAAPTALISNSFRRRLKGKERKLQPLARLSLSRRDLGRRDQPPARLVLPRQAAADGRTEAAERVRRVRRRGVHPRGLHDAARRLAGARSISTRWNATRK